MRVQRAAIAVSFAWVVLAAGAGSARAQAAPPLPAVAPPPLPALPPPPPYFPPQPPAPGPSYYPPTGSVPAPPALAPVATAPAEPPATLPYSDTDAPIPEGYRPVSKPSVGYLGIGIGMLSAGWVSAIVAGAVASDAAKKDKSPDAVSADAWLPMYVPVAGPFVTIVTTHQGPAGMGLLLCDGIFQTAGLLGVLIGSLKRSYKLVRTEASATVQVAPAVGLGFTGLSASGQF